VDVVANEGADYCICVAEMSFEISLREVGLNMIQICMSELMTVVVIWIVPVCVIVIVSMVM
jgi:hypothetical protein